MFKYCFSSIMIFNTFIQTSPAYFIAWSGLNFIKESCCIHCFVSLFFHTIPSSYNATGIHCSKYSFCEATIIYLSTLLLINICIISSLGQPNTVNNAAKNILKYKYKILSSISSISERTARSFDLMKLVFLFVLTDFMIFTIIFH